MTQEEREMLQEELDTLDDVRATSDCFGTRDIIRREEICKLLSEDTERK